MVQNSHPRCQKPDDCRVYRAGERLCPQCSGQIAAMSDRQKKQYAKLRDMYGPTRAKRLIIEGQNG
jgi:hypothetical protein